MNPNKEEFTSWLVQVVIDTFGGNSGLHHILSKAYVTGDNLLLDLNIDDKNKASIWVTETTLGGAGLLGHSLQSFKKSLICFFYY